VATTRFEAIFSAKDVDVMTSAFAKAGKDGADAAKRIEAAFARAEKQTAAAAQQNLHFADSLKSLVGGLGIGAVLQQSIENARRFAAEVDDLQDVLGVASGEAATLNTALKIVGATADDYGNVVLAMVRKVKENEEGFKALGLSLRDTNGEFVNGQEAVQRAIAYLETYREGLDRDAAAQDLMGKGAKKVFDVMDAGSEVMEYARERTEAYGLSLDGSGKALADHRLEVGKARVEWELATTALGLELTPAVATTSTLFQALRPIVAGVSGEFALMAKIINGDLSGALDQFTKNYDKLFGGIRGAPQVPAAGTRIATDLGMDYSMESDFNPGRAYAPPPPPVVFGQPDMTATEARYLAAEAAKRRARSGGGVSGQRSRSAASQASGSGLSFGAVGSFRAAQDLGMAEGIDLSEALQKTYAEQGKAQQALEQMREAHLRAIGDIEGAEKLSYQRQIKMIDALALTDAEKTEARALAAEDMARRVAAGADDVGAAWEAAGDVMERVFSDVLATLLTDTEVTMEKIVQTIQKALLSEAVQQLVSLGRGAVKDAGGLGGLFSWLTGSGSVAASGGGSAAATTGTNSGFLVGGVAHGGAWDGVGARYLAAGGIIGAPMLFSDGGRPTVAGEAGPEAVLPLRRDGSGDLGVKAKLPAMRVTINNYGSAAVDARQNADGGMTIDIDRAMAGVMARPDSLSRRAAASRGIARG
jgi:hypothetical protein